MTRRLLVVLTAMAGALVIAESAQAFTTTPVWQCRGSATYTSVAGNNRAEPIVANGNINTAGGVSPDRAQCVNSETGAGNTPTQLGIPTDTVSAVTGKASTRIQPELGRAIDQQIAAEGRVEDLTVLLGAGGPLLGVGAANSTAAATCVPGSIVPRFAGESRVADVTLGGVPVPLDQLLTQITNLTNGLTGAVAQVKVDERIETPDSLTIRALHVIVAQGTTTLIDLVVGEAKVGANGPVCDPTKQNDGTNTDTLGQVCAAGSVLDRPRNLCVIPAGTGGSSLGEIIIGRPFQGPSGGSVLPLDVARKRFGRSPCVSGGGAPKFVIVGTNGRDKITGTNLADRILGRGGNDQISGGRGNDCVEGGTGGDNMSGSLGKDKLYGASGKDHLNGGPGTDLLSSGSGNDSINAAFGRDRVLAGSGNDVINIATAGPPASANCGSGSDVIRINRNERRRIRGCERVAVFGAGDR